MPKLFSRMDDISWLTPSISDILDQGAAPPGGNGSIREQMLLLQQKLGELETPARVVNVRATPSYTLFIARPDTVGELGSRRQVTGTEIRRSLAHIAEDKKEWKLGFIPQLQEVPDAVGILLRTDEHSQLSLRRLLVRSTYRDHPSTLALVIGNTLEQQIHVKDLAEVGNLLIVGADAHKGNFVNSVLLTLISLNTPGELRIAIAAPPSEMANLFIRTPHALGRVLTQTSDAIRLIGGLETELERRQVWFKEENVEDIDSYNRKLLESGKTRIPRIVLLVDSFSDTGWQSTQQNWQKTVVAILMNRGRAGIHLILTANELPSSDVPEELLQYLPLRVITRSAGEDYANKLQNFHRSLMRFVDAFVVENENDILPVELCTISKAEVEKAVNFWQLVMEQRKRETQKSQVSGKTGVTGALTPPDEISEQEDKIAVDEQQPEKMAITPEPKPNPIQKEDQAQALAAYLGWIGIGPLQDILGMSADEAQRMIEYLKSRGIVEQTSASTPRFVRLSTRSPSE